jgi:hypothetical protein
LCARGSQALLRAQRFTFKGDEFAIKGELLDGDVPFVGTLLRSERRS